MTSVIACKLRIIVRHFEEISYKRTVTRLHLRANDDNLGPFFRLRI